MTARRHSNDLDRTPLVDIRSRILECVDAAEQGILTRIVAGRAEYDGDDADVRRHRADLRVWAIDLLVLDRVIDALDRTDAQIGGRP